jgi:hypothetical protein
MPKAASAAGEAEHRPGTERIAGYWRSRNGREEFTADGFSHG